MTEAELVEHLGRTYPEAKESIKSLVRSLIAQGSTPEQVETRIRNEIEQKDLRIKRKQQWGTR